MYESELKQHDISVKPSKIHGYGVFANKKILAGEIIEECYMIFGSYKDPHISGFAFGFNTEKSYLPLGFGMIYNSSEKNNAAHYLDSNKKVMLVEATKDILPGEEICINYGKKWFKVRKIPIKRKNFVLHLKHFLLGVPRRAVIALGGMYIAFNLLSSLIAR